jgi:hypothetical protein
MFRRKLLRLGVACLDIASKEKRWHRTDLKKVYGLASSADANEVISWLTVLTAYGVIRRQGNPAPGMWACACLQRVIRRQ